MSNIPVCWKIRGHITVIEAIREYFRGELRGKELWKVFMWKIYWKPFRNDWPRFYWRTRCKAGFPKGWREMGKCRFK